MGARPGAKQSMRGPSLKFLGAQEIRKEKEKKKKKKESR
jgi:hypothetical protein